jgi:drug/metabolite transporter (DMT)-like permease
MPRWIAVCLALFVTFLWSTSYILNKWAFAEGIGPVTLAGLRYTLAAMTLGIARLIIGLREARAVGPAAGRPTPWQFIGLGLAGYLVAQGFQYVGQYYVTPTQAGMLLSTGNTLLVLVIGGLWLRERPSGRQGLGIALALGGALLFYYPFAVASENLLGIGMILLSGVGYAVHLTANRRFLTRGVVKPLDLVLYPMIVGALAMVVLGFALEPWPGLTWRLTGLLLWLGPINGGLAFFLWTYTQKQLQAFESSTLNNTMLLQVAALDALLLGGGPGPKGLLSLVIVGLGITLVQVSGRRERAKC